MLATVMAQTKEKIAGAYEDVFRPRAEITVELREAIPQGDFYVIASPDSLLQAGERLHVDGVVYDIVQHDAELIPVRARRNDLETGWLHLIERGCDVGWGQMQATGKDHDADDYMDSWVGTFIKNVVENLPAARAGRHVGNLRGLCDRDVPVAAVGAGPSLDKNVDLLHDFPGLILCADKAYKMLRARGIQPDFVVSVDCHYDLVRDMVNCPENRADRLVLNTCADPQVARAWAGAIYWFNMGHPGVQFMDHILPALLPGVTSIPNAGCVGNTTVLWAEMLGAAEVLLVGQDFGYTGGRMHAQRFERDEVGWQRIEDDHEMLMAKRSGKCDVEGVTTYAPFPATYAPTMYAMRESRGINITNCTEGGILTKLPQETLAAAIERLRGRYGAHAGDVARQKLKLNEEASLCQSSKKTSL